MRISRSRRLLIDQRTDVKVLRNYYMMTVPQVSVFSGAIFGVMMAVGVNVRVAAGVFALIYGLSLVVLHIVVREHLGHLKLYKAFLIASVLLASVGVLILLEALRLTAHLY